MLFFFSIPASLWDGLGVRGQERRYCQIWQETTGQSTLSCLGMEEADSQASPMSQESKNFPNLWRTRTL